MSSDETSLVDETVVDEAVVESSIEPQEIERADIEIPDADWSVHGPRVWVALMRLLSSKKTRTDEGYTKIEVSHDVLQQVHDTVAEANK